MKRRFCLVALMLHALSADSHAQTIPARMNTLLPAPASLSSREGSLPLRGTFTVGVTHFHDARLEAAIDRLQHRLEQSTATRLTHLLQPSSTVATLSVEVDGPGEAVQSITESEAYTLSVAPSGAKLHAATVVGAMHGLETFSQLLATTPAGYYFPAIEIDDQPRFAWRGLMMDCGRHFEPIEVIKRTLDGMAAVKLNVFHWHLSEDQGFRIESKLFPRLTGMGSDGLFYTQDQAREVIAYARTRGIRVIPEFDMPGHSRSWFVGYPELASGPGPYTIRREFGIDDAAMDPTRESTYKFLDAFLGEMAQLFPDPYMHIGGDESAGVQWKANPAIQSFMRAHSLANSAALQAYFNQRLLAILEKHHKRMVGWDEIFNPALPKNVVIQSWRGAQSLTLAAQQGYQGILSQPYYLDAMKSAEEHYLADPLPSTSTLTPDQRNLVLGGEICMWAEHINEFSIDSRIWPRAAAIAERFWSPETTNDPDDMYRRLAAASERLESLGLTHRSHEDAALRALGGSDNIAGLRLFASLLQPVSFSDRYHQQHTDQLTPLTNLVDAVSPDPTSRHELARWTHNVLTPGPNSAQSRTSLESAFKYWLSIAPEIDSQLAATPRLQVALPLARLLPSLASAGLAALDYLSRGTRAPAGWKQNQLTLLKESQSKTAMVRYTFLAPLEDLIRAVPE